MRLPKTAGRTSRAAVRTARLLGASCLFYSAAGLAAAQTRSPVDGATPLIIAPGAPAGSYALSDFDQVNLFNGSLLIDLPLLRIQGRGDATARFTLPIQRRWVLDAEPDPNAPDNPAAATFHVHRDNWDWSGPAFERLAGVFGLGQLEARLVGEGNGGQCGGSGGEVVMSLTRLYFTASDGTELELVDKASDGQPVRTCSVQEPPTARTFVSKDGTSSATFVADEPIRYQNWRGTSKLRPVFVPQSGVGFGVSGFLYLRDGTRYRIGSGVVRVITDRNGNQLTLEKTGEGVRIKDSLDRSYEFVRANPWLPEGAIDRTSPCGTIRFSGAGGALRTVTISCTPLADALLEGQLPPIEQLLSPEIHSPFAGENTFNPNVVRSVELPNGTLYEFRYNAYAEVVRVELPTGGAIEYSYAPGLPGEGVVIGGFGTWYRAAYRRVVERRTYDAQGTQLSRTTFSRPETVLDPAVPIVPYVQTDHYDPRAGDALLRRERHYLHGRASETLFIGPMERQSWKTSRELKTEILEASGRLLRTVEHTWTQANPAEFAPLDNPHIVETRTTLDSVSSRQTFAYDAKNNLTDTSEFGFDGQLARHSHTDFAGGYENLNVQPPVYILDLPAFRSIAGPAQGSETTYLYDGAHAGPLVDRPGISGHDPAFGAGFTARGNLTALVQHLLPDGRDIVTQRNQYDIAGNVVKTRDARLHDTDFLFDDRWDIGGDVCGEPSGSATYAFPTAVVNVLGHRTCTRYDRDTGQPVQQRDPNGVVTELRYADALDRLTQVIRAANDAGARTQTSHSYDDVSRVITTSSDLNAFNDGLLVSRAVHDGLGRVVLTQQREDGGDISVARAYDARGRVSSVSNPYRGAPGPDTRTEYDALDRVTKVISAGGAETRTSYSSQQTTVTDPAGKVRSSTADALGRVVRVAEDGDGSEDCDSPKATCYGYDLLDNLTGVRQGAQTRTFVYDSLSRLRSAQNPESGGVIYAYDDTGNLIQRTDARGVVTDYQYDDLDRIRFRTYAVGSGAAATDGAEYVYDQSEGHPLGRLTAVGTDTSETVFDSYDALGRVTGHHQQTNGRAYETEYAYNRAGLLTSEKLPSGRELSIQYDSAGRINGMTGTKPGADPVTFLEPGQVRYAPHGAIEAMQLGSGRWEHTAFNARLQPEQIGVGSSSSDSGLLGISYDYGGSNNNGNVRGQTITAGGRSFQQTYTYDALNRLEGATEGRDGSTVWSQSYGHDRFGNRWVSGGFIPNPNLTPDDANDFDAGSNRVVLSQYDAAGNQKRDAVGRGFDYDAENRQVRFEAGSTAVEYAYDGDGRRVMKHELAGGHTWVYVYDAQGQLVTEHSDEDEVRPVKDFIRAGAKLIAEVKGSLEEGEGPVLLAPLGGIDNCAPNAGFTFSWRVFPGTVAYSLRVDGLFLGVFLPADVCSGDVCVVEPLASPVVEPFRPGPHTWTVRATTAIRGFSSVGAYQVTGPRPATPLSPFGPLGEPPTVFTWRHSPQATEYHLRIDGAEVASFVPADVCQGATCTATLASPPNLASGAHSWRVHGVFPQCELGSLALRFTSGVGTPCGATPINPPVGGVVPPNPFFSWGAIAGAQEYRLTVITPLGTTLTTVVAASTACQGFFCTQFADALGWTLDAPGQYRWKAVPIGIGNEACDGWPFTIDFDLPARPVPISPRGRTFTLSPPFRWRESARATEYLLFVEGTNPNMHTFGSEICSGGVCETPPIAIDTAICALLGDPALCSWQVIARNSFGASTPSEEVFFTVEEGDPCGTTRTWPASGSTVPPETFFMWGAVANVTEYRLSLTTPPGTVLSATVPAFEVCRGLVCTQFSEPLGWAPLAGGEHSWKVIPVGVGIDDCPGLPFTVDANLPARPVPISPSGRIFTLSPTFRWQESARATEYVVFIEGTNPNMHTFGSEICSGGVCETPPITIDLAICRLIGDPSCSWGLFARNSFGASISSDEVFFTVEEGDPCGTSPLFPLSGSSVPPEMFFMWASVANVQEYRLSLTTPQGAVLSATVSASEACQGFVCTRFADALGWVPLADGEYRWKVIPVGVGIDDCPGWPFTVDGNRPARPVPISPSGRVFTLTPTFRWQEAARATEYLVAIEGTNPPVHTFSATICADGLCQTPPISIDPALCRLIGDPACSWSLAARNDSGTSIWSDSVIFTVEEGDPCGASPMYPLSGDTVAPATFFQWGAVSGAQQYHLSVTAPDGTVLSAMLAASDVCQGSVCNRHVDALGWTLGGGLHRWRVVPVGIGDENCEGWPFTVDAQLPARPVPISPSGAISTRSPSFRWQEADRATEYVLAVEGANPNTFTFTSAICSEGVCDSGPIGIDPALCRIDPDPRCSWGVLARNSLGASTWTDSVFFSVETGSTCEQLAGPDRFCGAEAGSCPRGYDPMGPSSDCTSCCRQGPSCGTVGGPSAHCSQTTTCPQGYDALQPTYDCGMCCNNPPVCGDGVCKPGAEDCGTCLSDCPCPPGQACNAVNAPGQCVQCEPVGCAPGACGQQSDGCGGTIDCGPCVTCGDGVCAPGVEDCGTCLTDCPCWQEGTVCSASGSPGQCIPYCGSPFDTHEHSGSCGSIDQCGHAFGSNTDCGCPGDNHEHGGSCGSVDACGHGFGANTDCGCPGDNHEHGGSCGSVDACGHGFGANTDCGCPGDNHEHGGSCGSVDACGHGFGANTDCGCPGDNHEHGGSCGSVDACGHGFGANTDCGCPGDNHEHGGSCGSVDACGHGFGANTDCGCPGDNHDHGGSCGSVDACGHGFGANTDCG
jgi:YD repeat-containing protein